MSSTGRNDPCPCGSGKKYKKCCLVNTETTQSSAPHKDKQNSHGVNSKNVTPPSKLLMEAVALHQAGLLDKAEVIYQSLLRGNPNDSDALHYLGLIAFQRHFYSEAIRLIEAAIKINSKVPAFHCNLGNAYRAFGQLDSAIAAFLEAVRLDPKFQAAYCNLGNTLKDQGRLDEAVASYRKAIELRPNFAEAHNNLGVALRMQNRFDEAVTSFRNVLSFNPNYPDAYCHLGEVLKIQGKLDEAMACFQQQIKLTPENSTALHHIASLTGENTESAPAQYVQNVFDVYADNFDTHLQQVLKYDIPKKLAALVTRHATPSVEKWKILDLGCGTGLIGPEFAPYAQQLVGVDLSSKMLRKAQERNLYHRLECMDLLAMMRAEKASSYDLIIAADVFVYIGKLDEIISEIKRLLGPDGLFAFSVEALDAQSSETIGQSMQQEYQLGITGRYTHAPSYITKLASANGFLVEEMTATQIRMEEGRSVNGYMALWRNRVN